MIRIAHFLHAVDGGGVSHALVNQAQFWHRDEFEYVVGGLVPSPNTANLKALQAIDVPVFVGWAACQAMIHQVDLVVVHWAVYYPYLHALVQASGTPYMTILHWPVVINKQLALTACTSDHVYGMQPDKRRFVALYYSVDPLKFVPRPKVERDKVILTRVCRPNKCALYFWSAVQQVLAKYPQTHLWIVGDDGVTGQSTERVTFWGHQEDIPAILAETDIFVYTAYDDQGTRDLAVGEALAMGVPCVLADTSPVRERIVDGQNGFLVPFGDVDGLVEKISLLVENGVLRRQMGETAVKIIQEDESFRLEAITADHEFVYKTILAAYAGESTPPPAASPRQTQLSQQVWQGVQDILAEEEKIKQEIEEIKRDLQTGGQPVPHLSPPPAPRKFLSSPMLLHRIQDTIGIRGSTFYKKLMAERASQIKERCRERLLEQFSNNLGLDNSQKVDQSLSPDGE